MSDISSSLSKIAGCVTTLCKEKQYIVQSISGNQGCCGPLCLMISGPAPIVYDGATTGTVGTFTNWLSAIATGVPEAQVDTVVIGSPHSGCTYHYFRADDAVFHRLRRGTTSPDADDYEIIVKTLHGQEITFDAADIISGAYVFQYLSDCTLVKVTP